MPGKNRVISLFNFRFPLNYPAAFARGLSFAGKPLNALVLAGSLLMLFSLVSTTTLTLTRARLDIKVTYQPGYLEITDLSPVGVNVFPELQLLKRGDRIVKVNGLPLEQALNSKTGLDFMFYTAPAGSSPEFNLPGPPVYPPLSVGQPLWLWSMQPATLTLDSSHRENLSGNVSVEAPDSQSLYQLQLDSGIESAGQGILALTLFVIAFCFWASGILLYLIRPGRVITVVFYLFCNLVALYILVLKAEDVDFGNFTKAVLAVGSGLLGVLFYHFILRFPYDRPLTNRITVWTLRGFYAASGLIMVLRLYATFSVSGDGGAFEQLIRGYNFIILAVITGLGLITLGVKFFRTRGLERLRLNLAVESLILGVAPTLIVEIYYQTFEPARPNVVSYIELFFVTAGIIPLGFTYAVLKNELLGVSIRLRRFFSYILLVSLVTLGYFLVSTMAALFLPSLASNQEPILIALFIAILAVLLERLKKVLLKLVNRAFKVDDLDFSKLNHRWSNELVRLSSLKEVYSKVIGQLPVDYNFKNAGLLLCYPDLVQLTKNPGSPNSFKKLTGDNSGRSNLTLHLTAGPTCQEIKLNPQFWDTLCQQSFLLVKSLAVPEALRAEYQQLAGYEAIIPLRLGGECYGALALAEKLIEYPPTSEELVQISLVGNQIAAALHNSLLLAKAEAQAKTEQDLRRLYELIASNEQRTREEERLKLAENLHNNVLQDLGAIRHSYDQLIQLWLEDSGGSGVEPQAAKLLANSQVLAGAIEQIRNITFELMPPRSLIHELKQLVKTNQTRYPQFKFQFELAGDEVALENLLTADQRSALSNFVREALNNAVKHSGAQTVKILVELTQNWPLTKEPDNSKTTTVSGALEVRVEDNGRGMDSALLEDFNQLVENHYFGLSTIKQRIEGCDGEVIFHSELGKGMQVVASWLLTGDFQNESLRFEELFQKLEEQKHHAPSVLS